MSVRKCSLCMTYRSENKFPDRKLILVDVLGGKKEQRKKTRVCIDCKGDTFKDPRIKWGTRSELIFVLDLPEKTQQKYINSMHLRDNWGSIDKHLLARELRKRGIIK